MSKDNIIMNEKLEWGVLGAAIHDPDFAIELASVGGPLLFGRSGNQHLFKEIVRVIETLGQASPQALAAIGNISIPDLRKACELQVPPDHARMVVPELVRMTQLREFQHGCHEALRQLKDPKANAQDLTASILDRTERFLTSSSAQTYQELFEDVKNAPFPKMLKTPWRSFDEVIGGGIHEPSFMMVTAEANVGKTVFMCQLAAYWAREGKRVVFFSLEQPKLELARRVYKCTKAELFPGAGNLLIIDDLDRLGDITARMLLEARKHKENGLAFFLDYFQLIQHEGHYASDNSSNETMSHRLKRAVVQSGATAVVASGVNRREGDGLDRIRGSGAIGHDIDLSIYLSREFNSPVLDVKVQKHRNGPLGQTQFVFVPEEVRFIDAEVALEPGPAFEDAWPQAPNLPAA